MREIKFRAWDTDPNKEVDKEQKHMFYQERTYGGGSWLANFETDFNEDTGCSFDSDYVFAHSKEFTDWDFVESERKREQEKGQHINGDRCPDRFILMQYTGLTDKNGKDMYEGDIVKVFHESKNERIDSVIFEPYHAGFALSGAPSGSLFGGDRIEVIGNIYENPDLLKVKKETI